MSSQLTSFENYIVSLVGLGVFPSFQRLHNGWICVLRNGSNKQLMPLAEKEPCWGATIFEALTTAVNGLNTSFPNPKALHQYIDTGNYRIPEPSGAEILQFAKINNG